MLHSQLPCTLSTPRSLPSFGRHESGLSRAEWLNLGVARERAGVRTHTPGCRSAAGAAGQASTAARRQVRHLGSGLAMQAARRWQACAACRLARLSSRLAPKRMCICSLVGVHLAVAGGCVCNGLHVEDPHLPRLPDAVRPRNGLQAAGASARLPGSPVSPLFLGVRFSV